MGRSARLEAPLRSISGLPNRIEKRNIRTKSIIRMAGQQEILPMHRNVRGVVY
jgi:hypothetical protein